MNIKKKLKTVVITIHGQESIGKNMEDLSYQLNQEDFMDDCIFINLRYERLLTISNIFRRTRTMTAKYIAARMNGICLQYPNTRIIVIGHSNGGRAMRIAMDMRLKPKNRWPQFRVDNLILLGCPIKRNYNWSNHPDTQVINFVSTNDRIVWWARFYFMGGSGRFAFDNEPSNLQQIYVRWGHSGFMQQFDKICKEVKVIVLG